MNWKPADTAPEGVEVMTKIDDVRGERNVQRLRREGNIWWAGEMYVYYRPTHWCDVATG